MVTVLVIVAGIWLREQGPPLEGGDRLWESSSHLLNDAEVVLAVGARHTVVQAASGQPLLLDREDGGVHRLPGFRVVALADSGASITEARGVLYGADSTGRRTWHKGVGALVPGNLVVAGTQGEVAAVGGCAQGRGTTVGVRIADGTEAWRVKGPCPEAADPLGQHEFFAATSPAGARQDAVVHTIADGRKVTDLPGVRDVRAAGDVLLVLDGDSQLSARTGGTQRWLLDPETAALADAPATALDAAYPGTPAVAFGPGMRALVDTATGTLRRSQGWGQGPVERGAPLGGVAHGREYLWNGDTLVARNVFTGRELWRVELPAGTARAHVADPEVVTVSLQLANGRHQVFAFAAGSGEQVVRTRASVKEWSLLPTGAGTLLASSGGRHYLLDVIG